MAHFVEKPWLLALSLVELASSLPYWVFPIPSVLMITVKTNFSSLPTLFVVILFYLNRMCVRNDAIWEEIWPEFSSDGTFHKKRIWV